MIGLLTNVLSGTDTRNEVADAAGPGDGSGADAGDAFEFGVDETFDDAADRAADGAADGDVVSALVDQLRADEVTPGQRATIREELDIATPESMAVRLEYLQSRVAELDAYTDALEEFLDAEGGAEALLGALRADIAAAESRVDVLEAALEEEATQRAALAERLDALEERCGRLDDVEAEVSSLDDTVDEVAARQDQRFDELEASVEALRGDVEDGKELRERLSRVVGAE